ncbi:phage tail protein [Stappia sp. F7233]|uniref:Phage tail protein n=1 Tax=Stappia albiluteola TaxID=2758565 RepID=A0A839AKA5_9HYPH|nr:phage tail tube protein [Stappia albiluteola]MBA5779496.1 phage tail protein [Stappia albiluteola]
MAQQKGTLLLIKVGDGGSPETFDNLCGITTRSFNMGTNEVETTVPDCDDPGGVVQRTVVAGVRTQTFSGSGLFDNRAVAKRAVDAARLGVPINCQVIVPGYGMFEGPWIISGFEFGGESEGNMSFSATFSASDLLTFTAEV